MKSRRPLAKLTYEKSILNTDTNCVFKSATESTEIFEKRPKNSFFSVDSVAKTSKAKPEFMTAQSIYKEINK